MAKKNKKSPKQQPTEIPMADKDIMVITGIKMKYFLLRKTNMGIIISSTYLILPLYKI